jgi:hypothetical protein
MWDFFESLFCGNIQTLLDEKNRQLVECMKETENFKSLSEAFKIDLADAEIKCKARVHDKEIDLRQANIELDKTKLALTQALVALSQEQEPEAFNIDISAHLLNPQVYEPFQDIRFNGMTKIIADSEYYKYSKDNWKLILKLIQPAVKLEHDKWVKNVGDCDNFAEALHYMTMNATLDAGMDKQSAIGIGWSKTHAYNLFVATNDIWVYEPQLGWVMGKIGEQTNPKYQTNRVLFIG